VKLNTLLVTAPSLTLKDGAKTLYSVQFLRFIAAALVVLSHIRTEYGLLPFGDVGVDIFFVISGFIIYHVTKSESPHFFTKRLIRIVPLYWVGTLVLAAVAFLAPKILNDVQFDLTRVLASLLFMPYWTAEHAFHPILLLGWTLNYEILFYFLFYVAMRISHRHRFLVSSALLVALSLSHVIAEPGTAHFFWSGAFINEFIFGMIIAVVVARTQFLQRADTPLFLAAFGLALYAYLLYPTTGLLNPELPRVVTIGLLSMGLVLLVLSCERKIRQLPKGATWSIALLGDLSFAAYIFHPYAMGVVKRLIGLEISIYFYATIVLTSTCIVAATVFFVLERPSRSCLTRLLSRRKLPSADIGAIPTA
jgi:exopolysaccharide production protein ExoZ